MSFLSQGPDRWDVKTSADEARATGSVGSSPLVVLTRSPDAPDPIMTRDAAKRVYQAWLEMQEELAKLSSNSIHVFAKWAGHGIPVEEPAAVIDGILKVLEMIRTK